MSPSPLADPMDPMLNFGAAGRSTLWSGRTNVVSHVPNVGHGAKGCSPTFPLLFTMKFDGGLCSSGVRAPRLRSDHLLERDLITVLRHEQGSPQHVSQNELRICASETALVHDLLDAPLDGGLRLD